MRPLARAVALTFTVLVVAGCGDGSTAEPDTGVTADGGGGADPDGSIVSDGGGPPDSGAPPPRDLGPPLPVGEVLFVTEDETTGEHQLSSVNRDGSGLARVNVPAQHLQYLELPRSSSVVPADGPLMRGFGLFQTVNLPGGRVLFVMADGQSVPSRSKDEWLMLFDGRELRRVAVNPDPPAPLTMTTMRVSPDGKVVIWADSSNELHAVRVDGSTWPSGSTDRLVTPAEIERRLALRHQSARWVYFDGKDSTGNVQVHRVSVDGTATARVDVPAGLLPPDSGSRWESSADGAVTVFTTRDAAGRQDVVIVDGAGSRNLSRKAATSISSLSISPDGSRVAYATNASEAYVVSVDGTSELSVRSKGSFEAAVDFRHLLLGNGGRLYLSAGKSTGARELYTVTPSTLAVDNLTRTGKTTAPFDGGKFGVKDWFAVDGKAYYVLQQVSALCDNCYYLAALDGTTLTYVIEDGDGVPRDFRRVSPNQILFIAGEDNLVLAIDDLYVFDPTAPAPARRITSVGGLRNRMIRDYEPSPDRSRLAFVTSGVNEENDELWVISSGGGPATRVGPMQRFDTLRWTRDSAGFAYAGGPVGEQPRLYFTSGSKPTVLVDAPASIEVLATR